MKRDRISERVTKSGKYRPLHECYEEDPATGCWNWTKARYGNGEYGAVWNGVRTVPAHRFCYEVFYGVILSNTQVVDHKCRNKLCVNPQHLEAVNKQENRRRGIGAKLSAGDIKEIKRLAFFGATGIELSKKFNVSRGAISMILNGKRGADIPFNPDEELVH